MNATDPVRLFPGPTPTPAPAPQPAPEPGDEGAPRPENDRAAKQTFVWAGGENEFASRGRLVNGDLRGVPRWSFGLESDDILVSGLTAFRTGRRPETEHDPATANHDNFDQAVLYVAMREISEQYESLTGRSFVALVRSTGQQQARGRANSIPDVNAFYSRDSHEVHFGTGEGRWDLAADKDVVKHEMGHFMLDHLAPGIRHALHEGFGDAQATLSQGDPELSEDFGKISGVAGQGLRNANNDRTVANTTPAVHDRGRVYAGLFWEIGEHLHTAITGRARNRATDVQALDRRAADHALRILWTFPLFLGTTTPEATTIVRAVHRAIDSLAAAGKLRGVRVTDLKAFVDQEALRRGLVVQDPPPPAGDPGKSVVLSTQDRAKALDEAVSLAGLDPNTANLELVSALEGPMGEKVERFRIRLPLYTTPSTPLRAPLEGELLTLITMPRGDIEAQVGRIPEVTAAVMRRQARPVDMETLLESQVTLAERALRELRSLSTSVLPPGPKTSVNDPHLAKVALAHLTGDHPPAPRLVWRDGALVLQLELETLMFEGTLGPEGTLEGVRRHSAIECGPEGFAHRD